MVIVNICITCCYSPLILMAIIVHNYFVSLYSVPDFCDNIIKYIFKLKDKFPVVLCVND